MLEEGNQIGNHSYNHKNLTTISDEELYKQIKGTDDLVYIATGYTPSVMRPPYGSTNKELIQKISKPVIKWSVDTRDWENRNVEMINKNIFENVKDGDIILMHDLYESTLEASKIAIPELISRGFQIVTIDELFEYRGASLAAGEQYYNVYK
jgi:peptidoglycan/xylan/chitin deacetylase (PgdA/CDA1 family)